MNNPTDEITSIERALTQEARQPGTIDKVLQAQRIHRLISGGTRDLPPRLLSWYAGTLTRWRRSLRAYRPLADVPPADRPRIRLLLTPTP